MAFASQFFWQQFPSRLWQISLQLSSRGPGHRCAIATATMRPERGNARRCANCRSMRIAGGQRLVTKKVLQRRQWRRTIQIRTRKRRIALNRLTGRFAFQLSADVPNSNFSKGVRNVAAIAGPRPREVEPCDNFRNFPMTSFRASHIQGNSRPFWAKMLRQRLALGKIVCRASESRDESVCKRSYCDPEDSIVGNSSI
jgi:hypothetical protein